MKPRSVTTRLPVSAWRPVGRGTQRQKETTEVDRRAMHLLTLECGHQRQGPASANRKRCETCGSMQRVVDTGELVRDALGAPETRVQSRADGLTVRHTTGTERKTWWCRSCNGAKAPKALQGQARSMDEVFSSWDQHKLSPEHQASLRARRLVDDVVSALDGERGTQRRR